MSRRFAILERLVFVEIICTTGFEPMAKESTLIGLSSLHTVAFVLDKS